MKLLTPPINEDEILDPPLAGDRGVKCTQPDGDPSLDPPLAGGRGVPIANLRPGDFVYAHDGLLHRVLQTTRRRYVGKMVGISHAKTAELLWLTEDRLILSSRRVQALSQHGRWSGIPNTHVDFARKMRHQPTPPEVRIWGRLRERQLGVSFRRQHQIGPYIADFYCRQAALVIEIDGEATHSSDEARDYDAQRDAYMVALGLRVLRFTASDASSKTDAVVEAIRHATQELVLEEDSEKQWRYAGTLTVGDIVFFGIDRQPVKITAILFKDVIEEVYDLEIDKAHSVLTTVCAIHSCSSGATASS